MHRKVVGIDEHQPAVYLSVTAHYAVARYLFLLHPEARAAVIHQLVGLAERALVEQRVYSFTRRHVPGGVLFLYLGGSATL